MNNESTTHTPHWKLRRVAPRAVQVFERHKDQDPLVMAFQHSLIPAGATFTNLYDESRTNAPSARDITEGKSAVATLIKTMRGWQNLIARDVPSFKAAVFDKRAPVPDDIIASARRLVDFLRSVGQTQTLAYQADAEAALPTALANAEKEWAEVQVALSAHQRLLAETRKAATVLNRELIAFRRTLALVAGTESRDYRMLRTNPSAAKDDVDIEEGDAVEESATGAVDTAPRAPVPPPNGNGVHSGNGARNGSAPPRIFASPSGVENEVTFG